MRLNRLDILRTIAVFLVLGRHVYVTQLLMRVGWMGVDLFFVLSGFLVSGLLFNEQRKYGQMSVGRFWLRRAFKIYPPFYALLLMSVLTGFHQEGHFLPEALFYQNYAHGWWHHTWSLAVEEHFYLLLPVALLLLARFGRSKENPFALLPIGFGVLAALVLALRFRSFAHVAQIASGPAFFFQHVCPTHLRIDSLAFGVLISYAYHYHRNLFSGLSRRHLVAIAAVCACLIIPCMRVDVEGSMLMATVGLSLLYLGFGGILLVVVLWPEQKQPGRIAAALGYVGRHSYSIYLWHLPVMILTQATLVRLFPHVRDQVVFVVFAAISVAVGVVMAKLVETPALRLRDRLLPSRRPKNVDEAAVRLAS